MFEALFLKLARDTPDRTSELRVLYKVASLYLRALWLTHRLCFGMYNISDTLDLVVLHDTLDTFWNYMINC